MKIVVIGSNGQLGTDLCNNIKKYEVIPLDHSQIEIKNSDSCLKLLSAIKPDIILNTAAFHNVPECENNKEEAMNVNAIAPLNLTMACNSIDAELVHFSTDYVFDGSKGSPYLEEDTPNPLNFYGISKLAGEHAVRAYCKRYKIIRVSGIYGKVVSRAKKANFVSSMVKLANERDELKIVNDEVLAPTNTVDIAKQIEKLLEFKNETGIFHISNAGQCSWYEFACAIFKTLGLKVKVQPIRSSQFPSVVKRPVFSVLENLRLKKLGIYEMRTWNDALNEHLAENYLSSFS